MAGVKALRKLQFGRESVAGTAVASTFIWRGLGTLADNREVIHDAEDIGYLPGVTRTHIPKFESALTLEETEATYQGLPHILEMGVVAETPAQDGAGTDYIYEYFMPTTTDTTPKFYTIEGGDNQQAEEVEYCFVQSFVLSGNAGEAWKMSAEIIGRQSINTTFTGALSPVAVEDMLFGKTKLYIDAGGGTIGSTQKTLTLLSATLTVDTGLRPVYTADGNLYFTFVKRIMPDVTLALTFEHDGTATAEKTAWRAQTTRLIRLLIEGSAVGTPGTTYSVQTAIIDIAGRWETFEAIGEQDGNDIIVATLRGRESIADTLFLDMTVVNELTALP